MSTINSMTDSYKVDFNSLRDVAKGTYNVGEIVIKRHEGKGLITFDKINNHVYNTDKNVENRLSVENKATNAAVFKAILEHYGRNDDLVARVKAADIENCEYLLDSFANPFIKKAFEFLITGDLKDGKPLSRDEMKLLFRMLDTVDKDIVSANNKLTKFALEDYHGDEQMQLLRDVHTFKTTGQFSGGRDRQIMAAIKGFRVTNANSSKRAAVTAVSGNQRGANAVADANPNPVNREQANTGANRLEQEQSVARSGDHVPSDSRGGAVYADLNDELKAAAGKGGVQTFAATHRKLSSFVKTLYGDAGLTHIKSDRSYDKACAFITSTFGEEYREGAAENEVILGIMKFQNGFERFYEVLDDLEAQAPKQGKAERQKLIAEFKAAQMAKSPALRNDKHAAEAMGRVYATKCKRIFNGEIDQKYMQGLLQDMFSLLFGKNLQQAAGREAALLQTAQEKLPQLAKQLLNAQKEDEKTGVDTAQKSVAGMLWKNFNTCLKLQIEKERLLPPSPNDWSAHKKDALLREFLNRVLGFTPEEAPPEETAEPNLENQ